MMITVTKKIKQEIRESSKLSNMAESTFIFYSWGTKQLGTLPSITSQSL